MTTFWGLQENEIPSGYFWELPSENPLIELWIIEGEEEIDPIDEMLDMQLKEEKDTWIWTKIAETAKGGLSRIKEAWVWLAEWDFNIWEAFARGWAGALQTALSPISWLLEEWVEESIQLLSDDFKQNVADLTKPTIQDVVKWYDWQSQEQKRNLDNVWVWLELLFTLVGWNAIKKPLQEIAWEAVEWVKRWTEAVTKTVGEWIEQVWDIAKDITWKVTPESDILSKLDLETVKGKIWDVEVDIPKQKGSISEIITTPLREKDVKVLAGRALSPRTAWKWAKQRLKSITDVEKNAKKFYENIRTWVIEWDISTIENASQSVVDNIDVIWERIGNAIKQVEWNIKVSDDIINSINTAIESKGARVSPATTPLNKFIEDLGDWNLTIEEAFELKKVYQNEVSKLYKSGDSWTKQYKALSDWVKFLNTRIDEIIDNQLWDAFAKDKETFRNLKLIVDDIVNSSLVEWRRAPNTLAEQIWFIEWLLSPVDAVKQWFIQEIWELNTRGGAWKELIKIYDQQAINNLQQWLKND